MRVFLDTNIIIDLYSEREDFYQAAKVIFELAVRGEIDLVVSATTFVNAFFLLRKEYTPEELYDSMANLASLCTISIVDSDKVREALRMRAKDFEDSVQWLSANSQNADVIVTRDKHFKEYEGNIKTPTQFLDDYFENKQ